MYNLYINIININFGDYVLLTFLKMNGYKILSVILFCLISLVKCNEIVETQSGKVAGVQIPSILKNEKFYSFYSIPYGEPPVGNLRFMVSV